MHRIDTSTVEADKWGAGKDGFTEGDPSTGVAATQISDDWLDAVQEEIVAPIELMNVTLGTSANADVHQLSFALQQMRRLAPFSNYIDREPAVDVNTTLYAVCCNNELTGHLFVAVGGDAGGAIDPYVVFSTDGRYWDKAATVPAVSAAAFGVAYNGSNLFCAVGEQDGTEPLIMTSPDGDTWTRRHVSSLKSFSLRGIAYGNSLWVAVGDTDGTNAYIVTSTDGTTWTERSPTVNKNVSLQAVAYNDGLWVAVGLADGGDAYILTSTNGTTWTERANPKNFDLLAIAWVPFFSTAGEWVAVGAADGTNAYMVVSANGTTWSEVSNPENVALQAITTDGVATVLTMGGAGYFTTYALMGLRYDGWYYVPGISNVIWGIAYSTLLGCYVAVGATDGTNATIKQSHYATAAG